MTPRDSEGGREPTSTLQDKADSLRHDAKAAIDSSSQRVGETARSAVSSAKDVVAQVTDGGAALLHDARDAAAESYHSARDYAVESAEELSYRARRAGAVSADYARRAGASTTAFVTANALPLTLIGAGMGWLAWSMRKRSQQQANVGFRGELVDDFDDDGIEGEYPIRARYDAYGERIADTAHSLADQARRRVGALTDRASQSASALADRAAQSATSIADKASESATAIADRATHTASALADRASQTVDAVRTRVAGAASQWGDQASELSHEAAERLRLAGVRTRDFADENPLLVGAVAIAAGVGVGLLLPNTQPENRLLGETRDRLLGDARGLLGDARGIIDEARDTARQTAGQISQQAREAAQEIRNTVADSRISH